MMPYSFLVCVLVIFLRCSDAQTFDGPRCTMRSHGDPHVKTCNAPEVDLVTCYAPGMQTYLDIYFLRVTAFHKLWEPKVAVIKEILIDLKSLYFPYTIQYTYRASNGMVPSVFEYEANDIKEDDKVDLIRSAHAPTVELKRKFTAVNIIISTSDSSRETIYQITIGGPKAVMNTGRGILINGCSPEHVMSLADTMAGIRVGAGQLTRDEAHTACLENQVPASTPDMMACVFDVMFTGNISV